MLKHLATEPLALEDLELADEELHANLRALETMSPETISSLSLTFSVDRVSFGVVQTVDLMPNGRDVEVTAANLETFLAARLRDRVFDARKRSLSALLTGVYDVVPREVLMLLSARELELALCGIPDIDVAAWRAATTYKGAFADAGAAHPVAAMFWAEVESWDPERRAQLLQWCTGTSRVPVNGFEHLQGRDGVARRFTLTSVELASAVYPRAHTCFNRIDLPLFADRSALATAFDVALDAEHVAAFSMD